jgi:hypothetical protein
MSTLLITKQTGNFFSLQLNDETPIISEQNRLTTVGSFCHFKTVSGANIIKDQNILYSDITLVASGSFTFASVNALWVKLVEVGFFDGLGTGGGGAGVDQFTELLDTFNSYIGRDKQAVVVDESQLKLITVPFANVSAFTDLSDTPNPLLPNKMIITNATGTALIMTDLPATPETYLNAVGSFNYNDLTTQGTPIAITAGIEAKLTNDTLGDYTDVSQAPFGVSSLWNPVTNQFDFSQLSVGDWVEFRDDILIDLAGTNTSYQLYMKMAIGGANPWTLNIHNGERKATTEFNEVHYSGFVIGSEDTRDFPAELWIVTDANATVKVNGWLFNITRKNINIVDFSDAKQNKLVAGANITIDETDPLNPVISASGGGGGSETTTTIGALINSAGVATPNDTDLIATAESGGLLKKITWTNAKAFLKTYFDTIYTTTSAVASQITTALSGYLTSAIAATTYEPIKGSDDNYVTDAEKTVLSNTSGTNTGDGAKVYNVKDYGALGNGSTDDTAAIQTTINTAFAAGGGVIYFPIGVYIIGGALQTSISGINYNSQLYIPFENYTSLTRRSISFLGEVEPNFIQTLGISTAISPNSGVILRSTIQGSGTRPSVICSSASGGFNYTSPSFKNLSIQITPNGSNKITMGGINCENSAIANFENITCYPYNLNLVNSGIPDVIDVVGITMPAINCEHINTLKNCTVGGFTQGYLLAEHTSAYDIIAICCVNGFNQKANYHLGNYTKLSAFWCKVDFIVTGASFFNVANLQTEWSTNGKWYDAVTTLSDVSNYGHGRFNFNIIEASIGFNNDKFTKIGGTHIEVKPISLPALVNAQTGTTYIFKYADAFRLNSFSNASDVTVTIPPNSSVPYDINARLLIKRKGVGRVILATGVGVTLEYPSGFSLEINEQYDAVELVQESINTWGVFGALKPV